MVGHSGTLIDGDPVVCGGFNGADFDVKCFQYERGTNNPYKKFLQNSERALNVFLSIANYSAEFMRN